MYKKWTLKFQISNFGQINTKLIWIQFNNTCLKLNWNFYLNFLDLQHLKILHILIVSIFDLLISWIVEFLKTYNLFLCTVLNYFYINLEFFEYFGPKNNYFKIAG